MILFKNIASLDGSRQDYSVESDLDLVVDASELTLMPAFIDAHVHFRTPGAEYKENWVTASRAAIAGGVTTVFDMPNNSPSCDTRERLMDKIALIDSQLEESGIPLRYQLFFGADQNGLDQIPLIAKDAVGVKVYMGHSTGDLLMDDQASLEKLFAMAADLGIVVAVHAEDEELLEEGQKEYGNNPDPASHSKIRSRQAAYKASERIIDIARRHGTHLYIMHLSTAEEVDLIREAKKEGVKVFAETSPHHLCLNLADYEQQGTYVQMNPPIREERDQEKLWEGLRDGTIDSVGTDHAPHTREEKEQPYGKAPSGVPGIETLMPLLLNAYNDGKISAECLLNVSRRNIEKVYGLPANDDMVIVNLNEQRKVNTEALFTKCGWSPFADWSLKGWPLFTVLRGKLFTCAEAQQVTKEEDVTRHIAPMVAGSASHL